MLKVQGVSYDLDDQELLRGISFSLCAGDILLIVGSNGAGKTTLARLVCGLLRSTTGQILWRDNDIFTNYAGYLSDLQYIGHTTGSRADLTVRENLLGMQILASQPMTCSIDAALNQVGLKGHEASYAKQLSAGEKRRLLLTKLIMFETKLWILDEPFVALDSEGNELLHHLIAQHQQKGGVTLLTSHESMIIGAVTPKTYNLSN